MQWRKHFKKRILIGAFFFRFLFLPTKFHLLSPTHFCISFVWWCLSFLLGDSRRPPLYHEQPNSCRRPQGRPPRSRTCSCTSSICRMDVKNSPVGMAMQRPSTATSTTPAASVHPAGPIVYYWPFLHVQGSNSSQDVMRTLQLPRQQIKKKIKLRLFGGHLSPFRNLWPGANSIAWPSKVLLQTYSIVRFC